MRNLCAPIVVAVLVLGAWCLASLTGVSQYYLPAPWHVFSRLLSGIVDGYLLQSAGTTLLSALLGALLATVLGVPIGTAIAHWRLLSAALEPYLAASQAVPAVAFAPLLVLWVGYGMLPIVLLCGLMVIFPIIINTALGMRDVDPEIIGAARLDGADGWRLLTRIEFPLSLPAILAGLRMGFTLSVTGAVVGELVIGGRRGLGIELTTAQSMSDMTGMFAVVIFLATIAIALYLILRALENRVIESIQ